MKPPQHLPHKSLNQTFSKQLVSLPRPTEETNRKQPTHNHPEPILVRKSPLLPTPPASERISNNTNNYKKHITRPSPVNSSRHTYIPRPSTFNNSSKPTFARPAEFNNHRFHQQHHIPRPHTTRFNNQQPPLLPKPIMPPPKLHHKTISTASTATRTLYTATVCSNLNINSIQPTKQCISTSNQPFQPTPVLMDKWITAERHK